MNIGNPQACGQSPISYNRQVLAGLMLPSLLDGSQISQDVKETIKLYSSKLCSPIGAYSSNSKGHLFIRESIGKFIEKRDGDKV